MANPVSIALPGNIPPLEFAKHANWVDTKIKVVKVDVKVAPNALQKECQNLVVACHLVLVRFARRGTTIHSKLF